MNDTNIRARAAIVTRGVLRGAVVVAVILAASPSAMAQLAKNGAYVELGGSGIIPTLNYERNVRGQWYGRAGFSVVTSESDFDTDTTYVVPLTLSRVNRPASNHHLELGGGIVVGFGDEQDWYEFEDEEEEDFASVLFTGILGYRYQKPDGGFQFRAVFTPLAGSPGFSPWAGVSFGYSW